MIDQEPAPEVYSDVFDFAVAPYGLILNFGLTPRRPTAEARSTQDLVTVRMSLEQAKVLSLLLRKNLSEYERDQGVEISVPSSVYEAHYLRDRAGDPGRPAIPEILFGLGDDEPVVVRDDRHDVRGPLCEISCVSPTGWGMRVPLSYAKRPIRLVTAFFQPPAGEP